MTRDDIIRLAQEVDAEIDAYINCHYAEEVVVFYKDQLERFAALVAAAERKACAKLCDEITERNKRTDAHAGWVLGNAECADAIRARGE